MKEVKYVMLYLERRLTRIELAMECNKSNKLINEHNKVLKSLSTVYNYIMEAQ